MHLPSPLHFHRQLSPFGWLHPPQAQLSQGPNAQPGTRPRVAVLHQGHIHNHSALRIELQDRGYHFRTHSHGELLAHLIDAIHPGDAPQALRRASALLQGPNAFVVQFHDQPQRLLATRTGSAAALQLHPRRVELIVPAPMASTDTHQPAGIHWLPEGDVLDLNAANEGGSSRTR